MNSRIENYFADPKTRNRRILLFAVITVLLSRALIALVHVWYVSKYGGTGWWVTDLNAWDSAWYRSIVMEGYALEPSPGRSEVNWAFFPLLPMIVRGLYQLTGMEPYIIAMLVDTLFLMGIVIVSFVYISETRHSYTQAAATGIIFTFGAYSFYFSIMYTDALYLLLLLITLYALEKKEYLIMGMAGAFLSATRNTGIMVVFAVGVKVIMNYIEEADNEKKSFAGFLKYAFGDWKLVLGICLIPAGLFAFMAYLGWKMGDPLAFVHVQVAWGGEMGNPLRVLYGGLRSGNIRLFYLGVWGIAGGFVILVLLMKRRFHEAMLAMILLLIPMSVRLQSMPRYFIGSGVFVWGGVEFLSSKKLRFLLPVFIVALALMEFLCIWMWFARKQIMV